MNKQKQTKNRKQDIKAQKKGTYYPKEIGLAWNHIKRNNKSSVTAQVA